MKPARTLILLLALLQPGLAPAAATLVPAPEPATAADCPHAMDSAPGGSCEHDGCDCNQTCSSALFPERQATAPMVPHPPRFRAPSPMTRHGFPRPPFRPPSS